LFLPRCDHGSHDNRTTLDARRAFLLPAAKPWAYLSGRTVTTKSWHRFLVNAPCQGP
jgi:hypothetical protein